MTEYQIIQSRGNITSMLYVCVDVDISDVGEVPVDGAQEYIA